MKRPKVVIQLLAIFIALFDAHITFAQKTTSYIEPEREFKSGLDLFGRKAFSAAEKCFLNTMEGPKTISALVRVDAEFYAAACAIELFNKDGEWRMKQFITNHPESNKVQEGWFYLGKSNYRKKKYKDALDFFNKLDMYDLVKEDLEEFHFKRGYSFLQEEMPEKAQADFYEIKDIDNKYAHPANYFYSHIAYSAKNYAVALEGFTRLQNDPTFGSVVPYYIAQIYFIQGKYSDVVRIAPPLLSDTGYVQKSGEINRIIGQSYYQLADYKEAIPYLQKGPRESLADQYQLGYAYFMSGATTEAIPYLEKATVKNDSLAQNAYYFLGDCYRKAKETSKTRNAFFKAYQLGFEPGIRKDALFNFAKYCYETGFSPYNDAIKYFQLFIKEYPNSPEKIEAFEYLVNCFHATRNYGEAMRIIEKMPSDYPAVKPVYQQLSFFRAIEYFNNTNYDSAKKYFAKAIAINVDPVVSAKSKYWLGEIAYKNKEYFTALLTWKDFQLMPGGYDLKEYNGVNYNIGYSCFMNKNYNDASISFRKFLLHGQEMEAVRVADANVRTADCYFMAKNFSSASEYYETAIALNRLDVDYALYQKGICNGLLKNYKEKINDLTQLQGQFKNSPYLVPSIFEIAESYKQLNDLNNAILWYDKIINAFPISTFRLQAINTIGILYFGMNKYDKAFEYLDKVVQENPNSEEAKLAIGNIKSIFKEQNKPEEMEKYLKSVGTSISSSELDESYWNKASELYYDKKNCDLATPELEKYIIRFPAGGNHTEANFCLAECAYSKSDFSKALNGYLIVIQKPRNVFTETSLAKSSYILFKDKRYREALPLYLSLESYSESAQNKMAAVMGALRCTAFLGTSDTCIAECNKALNFEKLSALQLNEIHLLRARCLLAEGRMEEVLPDLHFLIKSAKNQNGAEAYLDLAAYYFQKDNYKETEKTVKDLINYPYTDNYWNTRGMMLMGDVYKAKSDWSSAEAVFKSVFENSQNSELKNAADAKLVEIHKLMEAPKAVPTPENTPLHVEFQNQEKDMNLENRPKQMSDTTNAKPAIPK